MTKITDIREKLTEFCNSKLKPGTAETMTWFGTIILIGALIPSFLAVMSGVTDRLPPVDIVLFMWATLTMFFVRAAIMKDILNIITIGFGFIINAVLMALILFK